MCESPALWVGLTLHLAHASKSDGCCEAFGLDLVEPPQTGLRYLVRVGPRGPRSRIAGTAAVSQSQLSAQPVTSVFVQPDILHPHFKDFP